VFIIANDVFLDKTSTDIISRSEGIVLLLFFAIFLAYNIHVSISNKNVDEIEVKNMALSKSVFLILLGLVMLVVGGKLIVEYAVKIALLFGLSERVIGLTIVSIGTSLPELATSLVAVRKKNVDIAVGNVVGSCIFNVFLILGVSSVIAAVPIRLENQFDLLVNILFSLMLFLFIFTGKGRKLDRWEGAIILAVYIAYVVSLLV
jgi:cation:H+ antiporter